MSSTVMPFGMNASYLVIIPYGLLDYKNGFGLNGYTF